MLTKFTLLFVGACCWLSTASVAQNITTPRAPSPAASVSQTVGISTVTVHYSRPSVKGREIWGKLVPYGWNRQSFGNGNEAPWRAGANENTVIEFSHPARVEGKWVPAGSYGLFFTINSDNSTGELILSKDYRSWGSFFYQPENDLFRTTIQLKTIPHTELLTYDFTNLTKNSTELDLNWEKKQFPVGIVFNVDSIVVANAVEELKGPVGFTWQGYQSAATYALQNKNNLPQAVDWIDKAIAQNRSFATLRVKADLLREMNKTAEAESMMNDAMAIATEAEINNYGYQLINNTNYDKAIEIFTINTQKFPKSANTWDSLGEAYYLKGDKKNAIASFRKSLNSNPSDATRRNSEKYLKQLGVM